MGPAWLCSGGDLFLAAASPLCPHMAEVVGLLLGAFSVEGTNLIQEGPTLRTPEHRPEAPAPNTITGATQSSA